MSNDSVHPVFAAIIDTMIPRARSYKCVRCMGDCYIEVPRIDADGERYEAAYPCPDCAGLGRVNGVGA